MEEEARQCPSCGEWRMKDNACNFVTCNNNHDGLSVTCNIPWCWLCCRVKGQGEGKCDDKTHNSH